jgi:hypothetical protein
MGARDMFYSAMIRFLHAATETTSVNVDVNSIRLFKNLDYKQVSDYLALPAGKHHIIIYSKDQPDVPILNKEMDIKAGRAYTLPLVLSKKQHRLISFENHLGVPKDESKMRFIHLSEDSPTLDFAVVKGDVVFPEVSFQQATDYLGLTPMTVDLELRVAGTKKIFFPLHRTLFKANEGYSLVAVGSNQRDSPFDIIMLKD